MKNLGPSLVPYVTNDYVLTNGKFSDTCTLLRSRLRKQVTLVEDIILAAQSAQTYLHATLAHFSLTRGDAPIVKLAFHV